MITKDRLKKQLAEVEQGIEQTKNLFQQLSGQKALIEGLLNEIEEKEEKETGKLPEGSDV